MKTNSNNTPVQLSTEATLMTTLITNEETLMEDLTLDFSEFSSADGTLPTEISMARKHAMELALDRSAVSYAHKAQEALALITAHHMLKEVGGKNTWIGDLIFTAAIESCYWWKNSPRDNKTTTHGKIRQDALIKVVGENSPALTLFKEAMREFKGYSIDKHEDGSTDLVYLSTNTKTKEVTKEFIKHIPKSNLNLSVTSSGLRVSVKYNTTITPVKGQPFIFNRNVQQTFGMNVINSNLEAVMASLRIHNEYSVFIDKLSSDKKITEYTKETYKFKKEDALVMLLLLKENNIDIKELFDNVKADNKKLLVLSRLEGNKGVKSLHRVNTPAHNFKEKYGLTGVVSTNDARNGFVTPMVTLPRLVEFTLDNGEYVAITRENVNKTISRIDKLNNAEGLWTRTIKLFVIADATKFTELNKATVGGNILVPDYILLSDGACRVVNDMDQGGIKASYTPFQKLDKDLAKGETCVISSAGFKGGMLAALGLAYGDVNLVKNLFNIIDINTVKDKDTLDPSFVQQSVKKTDAIIEKMQNAVLNKLTTMRIAGEDVPGVYVTVDVKITNAYSIDMMQVVEDQEESNGDKAMKDSKIAVEKTLEEIDTESKASRGLRAYVSERKAASADLFSVCDWMKSGLRNGTLKRKALNTKVISQEIQTIAHTYGKQAAMDFLEELLELQIESGFSVNKVYAYQLLGALDKEIIRTIDVKDIVEILTSSGKGLVEGSPVYSKTAITDILGLIGTEDYGWVTVNYPDGSVDLPLGSVLLGDTLKQMENDKGFIIAKGLLADFLENCKTLIKDNGEYYENTSNHLLMEALVQKPLLGKNFGYQFIKGYYGVALPMLGDYGVSTAGITNRNRMIKSDRTWEVLTLSKAPQYFKGMTATYNVVDLDFGADLNLILECAVFVNMEIVLMHQNDFDGDMYRITLGTSLPFVEVIYNEFNGNYFKDFYEGELASNKFKMKKSQQCTLEAYHEAVFKAIQAKDHIGSYTANSYFYEAMLPNLINTHFTNVYGNVVDVTSDKAYQFTAILKMLIQIEAMDNVKQVGSDTYITEMLMHYKLRGLKGYAGKSDEEVILNHLGETKKALMSLVISKDMSLDNEQVSELVDIAYYTSLLFTKENTSVFSMFNARNIEEKNFNNIMNFITTGEELDTSLNFNNSYELLLDQIDTESMYYEILVKTLDAIQAANGKIRI